MDYHLTAMIIEGGRAFSLIEDPNLRLAIKLAKAIPTSYVPPSRHKLVEDYLPMMYKQRMAINMSQLEQHKEIFGLGVYLDGATIKKMPLYNFLACGAYNTNAVLEIKDCSSQMATGGKKDAKFLADILEKHLLNLDPTHECVDYVIMDGASNVQKAGRILANRYPRLTPIHGAEQPCGVALLL
jgi:hypothetical protein